MTAAVDPGLVERLTEQGDQPAPLFDLRPAELRIGSLFTGTGALDLAIHAVTGATTAWVCDNSPAAARLLAHRMPDAPNLGDITQVDWDDVEPVDILAGGFPCQDLSPAGRRLGLRPDTRSGLWAHFAYAIARVRPRLVVIENVRGLLTARGAPETDELLAAWAERDRYARVLALIDHKLARATREGTTDRVDHLRRDHVRILGRHRAAVAAARRADARIVRAIGTVLGTLADLGFDAEWVGLPASDHGAPHPRFRIFILAWPAAADTGGGELQRRRIGGVLGEEEEEEPRERHQRERAGHTVGDRGADAADPPSRGRQAGSRAGGRWCPPVGDEAGNEDRGCGDAPAPDGSGDRRDERRPGADRDAGRPEPARRAGAAPDPDSVGPVRARSARGRRTGPTDDDRAATDTAGGGRANVSGVGDGSDETFIAVARAGGGDRVGDPTAGDTDRGRVPCELAWGPYEPAIRRWELILGRTAPAPMQTGDRGGAVLSARLTEWMMGLPDGWVTNVPGLTRAEQITLCGNGVVPAQAAAALTHLLGATETARQGAAA